MKRLFSWVIALVCLAACNQAPTARISATIDGAANADIVLQKLNYDRLLTVDTIRTNGAGQFNYKVRLTGNEPYFYYLYRDGNPIASLILLPSDQVTVTMPEAGRFTVEGSEESALFQEVNEAYAATAGKISALAAGVTDDSSAEQVKEVNRQLSKLYVDYKRQAIKYMVTHPHSITSAVVAFQKFGDDLPVFGQESDAVLLKTLRDSLSTVYPKSEFLTALRDEVDARARNLELSKHFGDVKTIDFPDLVLPDLEGQMQQLSSLEGKVIILSFWSVGQTEHKMFNVDLVELYDRYHSQGLEIYQVSLDIDKAGWASTVRSQNLPWISVNDGLGVQSSAVFAYNVDHIPAMYVIDREGSFLGSDVFDKAQLEQLVRKAL
ncbi:MAG: AhpC/TSA family protein [Bacteroidales bacterium]|nr:AhpC/TSA family protein [Bacteroidales bacterium]